VFLRHKPVGSPLTPIRDTPNFGESFGIMRPVKLGSVLVVDDDRFVRTALDSTLSNSGFDIAGSVSTAKEALVIHSTKPADVALLDLDLGIGPTGFDLAHALRKTTPQIGIVFLTSYQDPRFASISGISAPKGSRYLVKSEVENVAQIISTILQTKHRPFNENVNHINKFEKLTDLQIEVWREVAQGLSSSEIAARRNISEKAVEAILARIYTFLEIRREKSNNPRILLANSFKKFSGKI
jgi:DNA-binding NarL/FixJ family response regulator